MKKHAKFVCRHTAIAAALMTLYSGAYADDEVAEFTKPDSYFSAGVGSWSGDRRTQGQYDGMSQGGVYGLFDIDVKTRNDQDGTWVNVVGRGLGVDPRELSVDYLRQGNFGVGFDYNVITRDNPLMFNSGITGKSSETQNLVRVNPGAGSDFDLGTKREQVGLRFTKSFMPGLDLSANYTHEDKTGTRNWGRGGAAEFAVEPIDSTTQQFETRLDYAQKDFQIGGGYYGSWYQSQNGLVKTTENGTNPYYLSLPLDNFAHQFFLDGGYNFTPTTRGTFKWSYTRAEQDETIPSRVNPNIPNFAGAPMSLDGRVDTTLFQLGLTSRPIKELSIVANLRYHDVDDKTPNVRVISTGDCTKYGNCISTSPFSYRTISGKLEGTYRLPDGYAIVGGIDHKNQDRPIPVGTRNAAGLDVERVVPMRSQVDETSYRLEGRKAMSDTINGSLSYVYSKRDGDSHTFVANAGGYPANWISPINISDRTRDKVRLALDWTPVEQLTTQFIYENAKDNYGTKGACNLSNLGVDNKACGMQDGRASIYTIDATYALNENWSFNGFYSFDDTKANQLLWRQRDNPASGADPARPNPASPKYMVESNLREKGNSLGLGMHGKVLSNLTIGADFQWYVTESKMPQYATPDSQRALDANAPAQPLNSIENHLTRLSLTANYAIDKHSNILVNFIHEHWKTDDWTWNYGNGATWTYGSNTDGTTVTQEKNANSNFVGVRYVYRFQ